MLEEIIKILVKIGLKDSPDSWRREVVKEDALKIVELFNKEKDKVQKEYRSSVLKLIADL